MGNRTVDTTIGNREQNIDLGNRSILPQLAAGDIHYTARRCPVDRAADAGVILSARGRRAIPYGPVEYTDEQGRHILPMTQIIEER